MKNSKIHFNSHAGVQIRNPISAIDRIIHEVPRCVMYKEYNPKWWIFYIGWLGIVAGILLSFSLCILGAIWFSNTTGYKSGWLGILTGEVGLIISFFIYTLHDYLPNRRREITKYKISYD